MGRMVWMEPESFRTWLERGGVLAAFPPGWKLTEIGQVNDHTLELHVAREGESLRLRVARTAAVPERWLCASRNFKACYAGKDLRRPAVVARILKALLAQDGPDLEVRDRPEPYPVEPVAPGAPERRELDRAPAREADAPSGRRQPSMLDDLLEIPVFDVELTADCNKSCSYCPRSALGRERFVMSDEVIEALLRFVPRRAFVGFAGIGEPLMHPRLFDVIRELRRTGDRIVHLNTNGSLLGPRMVERLLADPPDSLHLSVHLDHRDEDGRMATSPAFQRTVDAALPRLRERMSVTVLLMTESYSEAALAEATERWRASGVDVVEHQETCNRGGNLAREGALVELRTSPAHAAPPGGHARAPSNHGIKCTIFSRVTFVSSDGDVLACCNDVASQVRLGHVAADSYASLVRKKRAHIQRDEWPEICVKCDARRDVAPVSAGAHPRLEIAASGPWVTRDGGFPLGRFHASVVATDCTRMRRLADGSFGIEVLEDGVRAVLDRMAGGHSVLFAGDADAVILQARALRRFGRPVPMVGCAMSAAAVESADRFVAQAEGESVLRRLGRAMPWILFNENDLDRLAELGVPAPARHFGAAGTYLLRTLADGVGAVLDALHTGGSGVFAGGRSLRDYATLAAAVPALGAPLHVVGAPEHAALFDGAAGVTFEADLNVTAFHRAMARARVVVVPLEQTEMSAGHLTIAAAHRMGKPVVATRVPGVVGYVEHGHNGLLVPPGEPAALAQAIRALLDDDALAQRLGEAGRASELSRCATFEDLLLGLAESVLHAERGSAVEPPPLPTRSEPVHIRLVLAGAARPPNEGGTTAEVPPAPWLLPAGVPEPPRLGGGDALCAFDQSGAVRVHAARDARLLVTELFEEAAYDALLAHPTSSDETRVHCLHVLRYFWAARFAASAGLGPGARVLDVGCGVGYGAAVLRRAFADVSGLDFDPAAVELARRHWGAALGNPSRLVVADLLALAEAPSPWAGGAQLVTCFECIEHLVDPVRGMRALRHLLAPDGLLLASVPFDSDSHHTVLFTHEDDAVRLAKTAFSDVRALGHERAVRIGGPPRLTRSESYLLVCRA
jgi:MoaA/NifB/PqqE/SkfB family radical SAM enzyme/SAM-dependent methyltransferase